MSENGDRLIRGIKQLTQDEEIRQLTAQRDRYQKALERIAQRTPEYIIAEPFEPGKLCLALMNIAREALEGM